MNEKFKYRSRCFGTTVIIYPIVCLIATLLIFLSVENVDYAEAAIVIYFLIIIVNLVVWMLQYSMPAKFTADRNSVEFRLMFRKINIRYSSIKSIEITREYAKPQVMNDRGHYNEIIEFVCGDSEYRFENIMDIDLAQTAENPESLTEQFECGKFTRLKNYISKQTGTEF